MHQARDLLTHSRPFFRAHPRTDIGEIQFLAAVFALALHRGGKFSQVLVV
jgi:hypothetical protein